MIILEGADGSGKTTLLNDLMYIYPNLKNVTPAFNKDTAGLIDRCNQLLNYKTQDKPYICDRSPYISEMVYGTLVRHCNRFAEGDLKELGFRMLQHHKNHLIILCDPCYTSSEEFLQHHKMKEYDDVEEVKKVAELYPKITGCYWRLVDLFHLPVVSYNYRDAENRNDVIKKVGDYINER